MGTASISRRPKRLRRNGRKRFWTGGYPRRKPRDGELSRTNLRRDAPKGKHSHGADVRAQVIIADEPTTALDCVVKQQVIELFHSINEQQHVAIIMISHDLNLIRRYCDKVAVMMRDR